MKKLILIIIIASILVCSCQSQNQPITTFIPDNDNTLTIMNWNIQIFGKTKWGKPEIRKRVLDLVPKADIIFIQEIRDKSGDVFRELCAELDETHKCNVSSRAGRSASKEQYGVIYKKDIKILSLTDFNPDEKNRWERPPIVISFNTSGYILTAHNIHTKPRNATLEIKNLENIIDDKGNIIILGDLNADCTYYNPEQEEDFIEWHWVIKDTDDTTVSKTNCAYDRIIINNDMKKEYIRYGIYKNITKELSDHYPVWVELEKP